MTKYTIDVVSDTVCPWCYVGNKRLELAIAEHKQRNPNDDFAVAWHPFQLAPDMAQTVNKQDYYEQRFGAQRTKMMQAHLSKVGKDLGIDFAYGGKVGNTRDSHRLVQLGKTKSEAVQSRVMQQLFQAYFEKNEDITDHSVLLACATRAGLDEEEVREWLASDRGSAEVAEEVRRAQSQLVSGVPNFMINGAYEVHGAEEPSAFLQIFEAIKSSPNGGVGQQLKGQQVC